jgi:putative transposase
MSRDTDTTPASWEWPEAVWQRMEPLMPRRPSKEGRPQTVDLRRITEGIFSVLRTGIPWPACPRERCGPPSPVDYDVRQWGPAGVLGRLWAAARSVDDDLQGRAWTWQRVDGARTTAPVGERPRAPIPRPMARVGRRAVG